MLYKKNTEKELSPSLFKEPTCEYRGAPFYAWNCVLTKELLGKEIEDMKAMGFGGFHMHPRVGLVTPYLSDEFMDIVGFCVEKAKSEKMLAWLYDEDKWPSGFAGGFVTKDIEKRQKKLIITPRPYNDGTLTLDEDIKNSESVLPKCKYYLLSVYDIIFDSEHYLSSYKTIKTEDKAEGEKWFAYVLYSPDDPWYNNCSYCDTLSKPAIEKFVQVTHERYKECVGKDFGNTVPAIFSDEPQFAWKKKFSFSDDKSGAVMPYTNDFNDTYKETYGEDFIPYIPEIFWELSGGRISVARYRFHDHIAERFASAFADTIGDWCNKNGIALTGHMMQEPTLHSQTGSVGDAMRSYRGFEIPGIDMLADGRELTTAKQAQSAVHQYGREGMLSELYGVIGWGFDFRGHKLQGDWQAALGVTVRVPHLNWASMRGEAKRDYPAAIGYQSPWFKEYKYVEDHFARVNTVMTRGKPDVKIAVVHPVESYWLHWGPADKTGLIRDDMGKRFSEITEWLLYGCLDFDFICESNLPKQYNEEGKDFTVGEMSYKAVIVPYCETLRGTTLAALKKFRSKGGCVIFAGEAPTLIDALPSDEGVRFAEECKLIPWSRGRIYSELEKFRTIDIRNSDGTMVNDVIYQSRYDGEKRYVFISHVEKPRNYDVSGTDKYSVSFDGELSVTEYDTLSGEIKPLPAIYKNGRTVVEWENGVCSSLLIGLVPGKNEKISETVKKTYSRSRLSPCVPFRLYEPNVLLLDAPCYSLNGEPMHAPLDILKVDNEIRARLGMRIRGDHMAQPWVVPYDTTSKGVVSLTYKINSEIEASGCKLALESEEFCNITLNGESVPVVSDGYYVDMESIHTIPLPKIIKGENILTVEYRFCDITQLEAMYLLGDFGVSANGACLKIVPMSKALAYDDITSQTLPFYGGNIDYITGFEGGGNKTLIINKYRGSLIGVSLDGKRIGVIAYPPYRLALGKLGEGHHDLTLTLFGNRYNTFGPIHNTDEHIPYCGPGAWRTRDSRFVPEYLVSETGILCSPEILTED